MTKQVLLRGPNSMMDRRQPLLDTWESSRGTMRTTSRLGEVAGGTAAECAAVCCCCPCAMVNLLVLAMYKLPAGLCRKALRKKRRLRMIKKGMLPQGPRKCGCDCDEKELQIHPISSPMSMVNAMDSSAENGNLEVMELEKEMWEKFYGAGFWRSNSQRSEHSSMELKRNN